jgi:hypothetical protein
MKGLSWQTCPWKETTGISGDVSPHAKDLFSVNEQSNNIDYVTAMIAALIVRFWSYISRLYPSECLSS